MSAIDRKIEMELRRLKRAAEKAQVKDIDLYLELVNTCQSAIEGWLKNGTGNAHILTFKAIVTKDLGCTSQQADDLLEDVEATYRAIEHYYRQLS